MAAAAFHITKENEEKVLKELATEFRRLSKDLNTRIDDLRMEVNRVETNGGQEMKAHQDKLDKLETELQDRDKDVQKVCIFNSIWAMKKNGLEFMQQLLRNTIEMIYLNAPLQISAHRNI